MSRATGHAPRKGACESGRTLSISRCEVKPRPLLALRLLVRQRVQIADHRAHSLVQHMGVNLGRRNVGVTKKLLHDTQIGAILQEMAGKSVAQDMRTDASPVDSGQRRHELEIPGEGLAGQVPAVAIGREEPLAIVSLGRLRHEAAKAADGLDGQRREGNQTLPPALALDGEHLFAGCRRAQGQGDQLGNPQSCRVEYFQEAGHPGGPNPFWQRPRDVLQSFGRYPQKPADILYGQGFGEASALFWPFDDQGGIVAAATFDIQELVKLANGRQAPRGGRRAETAGLKIAQKVANRLGVRVDRPDSPRGEKSRVVREVPAIGQLRVFRRATLGREHVEEHVDQTRRGGGGADHGYFPDNRPAGIVCDISRGWGVTKVASANIAPQPRAPRRPTISKKRIRLGKRENPSRGKAPFIDHGSGLKAIWRLSRFKSEP